MGFNNGLQKYIIFFDYKRKNEKKFAETKKVCIFALENEEGKRAGLLM